MSTKTGSYNCRNCEISRKYIDMIREIGRLGDMGDWEIGRLGDWEIGRLGDWEIGRLGDWEIGRLGD